MSSGNFCAATCGRCQAGAAVDAGETEGVQRGVGTSNRVCMYPAGLHADSQPLRHAPYASSVAEVEDEGAQQNATAVACGGWGQGALSGEGIC